MPCYPQAPAGSKVVIGINTGYYRVLSHVIHSRLRKNQAKKSNIYKTQDRKSLFLLIVPTIAVRSRAGLDPFFPAFYPHTCRIFRNLMLQYINIQAITDTLCAQRGQQLVKLFNGTAE